MAERNPVVVTAPGERDIVVERAFDAPRDAVFAAYTRPVLLRRWFGPHGHTLTECAIDLRVGGHWRYVVRADDGSEMVLRGVYREIDPPALLVTTQIFGDEYVEDAASLVWARFDEHAGRTRLTITVRFATADERDRMASTGMAEGMGQGYDRLDTLLRTSTSGDDPIQAGGTGRETCRGTAPSGVREGAVAPSPGGPGELARPAEKMGAAKPLHNTRPNGAKRSEGETTQS